MKILKGKRAGLMAYALIMIFAMAFSGAQSVYAASFEAISIGQASSITDTRAVIEKVVFRDIVSEISNSDGTNVTVRAISGGSGNPELSWSKTNNPYEAVLTLTNLQPNTLYTVEAGSLSSITFSTLKPTMADLTYNTPTGSSVEIGSTISFRHPDVNMSRVTVNGSMPGSKFTVSSGGDNTYYINNLALTAGTTYTITVRDSYDSEKSWSFTVKAAATPAPTVTRPTAYLSGSSTNIDPRTGNLYLVFSKNMNSSTINNSNIYISATSGGSALIRPTVSFTGATTANVYLANNTTLVNGKTYYLIVNTSVRDTEGQTLASTYSVPFSTVAGVTRPTVYLSGASSNIDPRAGNLYLVFSKNMNSSTITNSNIYISATSGGSALISPTVTYTSATTATVYLANNSTLLNNKTYYLVVNTYVKDTEGQTLASAYSVPFTTSTVSTTNPTISYTGKTSSVSPKTDSLTLSFDKDINSTTVNYYNVYISESSNGGIFLYPTLTLSSDKRVVTASWANNTTMLSDRTYYLVVTTGLKDTSGYSVASMMSYPFVTGTGVNPVVSYTGKTTGADPRSDSLTLAFDKDMNESTLTQYNVYISETSNGSIYTYPTTALSANKRTATVSWTNNTNLTANKTYYLVVTTGVKDTGGYALATTRSFAFSTGAGVGPYIYLRSPESGATEISLDKKIEITFSESMKTDYLPANTTTSKSSNVYLVRTSNSTNIPCSVSWSGNKVTLTPNTNLESSVEYTVYVTTSMQSTTGYNMSNAQNWTFKTSGDSANAFIKERDPSVGATEIAVSKVPSFVFVDSVNESTVNSTNIYIKKESTGTLISSKVTYDSYYKKVTITPTSSFENDTFYSIYVTTGVKDTNGYSIPEQTWNFKTVVGSGFKITSNYPGNASTNIAVNTKPTIELNRDVLASTVSIANVYLSDYGPSNKVDAQISIDGTQRIITISPMKNLEYNRTYTVYVENGLRDVNGNNISATSFSFTTAAKGNSAPDAFRYGTSINPVVCLNGKYLEFDSPPIILNNRTMVPFRVLFEELGTTIRYDDSIPQKPVVYADYGDTKIVLFINSATAYINGVPNTLDSPAIIRQNRTLVPLRFVSEALGMNVDYDENTFNVTINDY